MLKRQGIPLRLMPRIATGCDHWCGVWCQWEVIYRVEQMQRVSEPYGWEIVRAVYAQVKLAET